MSNYKLWLGGITNGPANKVQDIVQNAQCFDGLVWTVDDRQTDETYELLSYARGAGKIIKHPFMQAHDWQANQWLHCGVIKPGDWVCILDTTDKLAYPFVTEVGEWVRHWNKNGVRTVYLDRPFFFKFTGHQYFQGSPHWGVVDLLSKGVSLSAIEGYVKENYVINSRVLKVSAIEHPIKYFIEYKRSNQTDLLYRQFTHQIWQHHEALRVWFQSYVEETLGFPCTVSNLVHFISRGIEEKNLPNQVIDYIELEVNMKDLVRYYILKQGVGELSNNRFNWSFKKFYTEGVEHQGKTDGYIGVFNQYRLAQGKQIE